MGSVEHPPPKNPNPLTLPTTEERSNLQPPGDRPFRKLRQSLFRQPHVLVDVGLHGWLIAWRQEVFDRRLRSADKLGQEAALRKKLVDHDGADRVGLLMWLEAQQLIRHRPPHGDGLVRLAGVSGQDVLEDRLDGL